MPNTYVSCDENGILPQYFAPKNNLAQHNHDKNIRQFPTKAYTTKYLTSNPQNYQGHRKKETLRNCHS